MGWYPVAVRLVPGGSDFDEFVFADVQIRVVSVSVFL
jgi:hypothetical protein